MKTMNFVLAMLVVACVAMIADAHPVGSRGTVVTGRGTFVARGVGYSYGYNNTVVVASAPTYYAAPVIQQAPVQTYVTPVQSAPVYAEPTPVYAPTVSYAPTVTYAPVYAAPVYAPAYGVGYGVSYGVVRGYSTYGGVRTFGGRRR